MIATRMALYRNVINNSDGGIVFSCVCLSVCLSVCQHDNRDIVTKFSFRASIYGDTGGVGQGVSDDDDDERIYFNVA